MAFTEDELQSIESMNDDGDRDGDTVAALCTAVREQNATIARLRAAPVRRAEAIIAEMDAEMRARPMNLVDPLCLEGLLRYVATGERVITAPAVAESRHGTVLAYLRGGGRLGTWFMHVAEADTGEVE